MAKKNAAGQDFTNNADGWDLTGGTTGRKLTVTGSNITLTGSGSNVYTFPAATDTIVGRTSTDTLTNKTITLPNITDHTGVPSTPATGVTLFSRDRTGRKMLAQIGPSGVDYSFQPAVFGNPIMLYQAQGGNTTTVFALNYVTTNLGTPTARTQASTNFLTQVRRLGYVGATTASSVVGTRHAFAQWWIGSATGNGGFFAVWRFGIAATNGRSDWRFFCGMSNTTGALGPTVDPSTYLNYIGITKDSADTTFQASFNNGTGTATKVNTGITPSTTTLYEVRVFCAPNGSTAYASITDLNSNVTFTGSNTSDLPANTLFLCPQIQLGNNGTTGSTAVALDVQAIYLESDN